MTRWDIARRRPIADTKSLRLQDSYVRHDAYHSCRLLAEATAAFYEREAALRGQSVDHVILTMQHGAEAADLWARRAA